MNSASNFNYINIVLQQMKILNVVAAVLDITTGYSRPAHEYTQAENRNGF